MPCIATHVICQFSHGKIPRMSRCLRNGRQPSSKLFIATLTCLRDGRRLCAPYKRATFLKSSSPSHLCNHFNYMLGYTSLLSWHKCLAGGFFFFYFILAKSLWSKHVVMRPSHRLVMHIPCWAWSKDGQTLSSIGHIYMPFKPNLPHPLQPFTIRIDINIHSISNVDLFPLPHLH